MAIANNLNTSEKVLQYLKNDPNTPLKVLEKLGQEFPEEIIANPIFDLLLLENPHNILIRLSVARSSKVSAEILIKLSKCDSFDIREAVAENLNTPLNVLNNLIARVNNKPFPTRIFTAIAENPNATAEILDKLIQAGNCLPVHLAVLENPKVSIMTCLGCVFLIHGFDTAQFKLWAVKKSRAFSTNIFN